MKFKSFKDQYIEHICKELYINPEDLTPGELDIIGATFSMFKEKLEDIKILNDENRRISIELSNLKSSLDNKDYE